MLVVNKRMTFACYTIVCPGKNANEPLLFSYHTEAYGALSYPYAKLMQQISLSIQGQLLPHVFWIYTPKLHYLHVFKLK